MQAVNTQNTKYLYVTHMLYTHFTNMEMPPKISQALIISCFCDTQFQCREPVCMNQTLGNRADDIMAQKSRRHLSDRLQTSA